VQQRSARGLPVAPSGAAGSEKPVVASVGGAASPVVPVTLLLHGTAAPAHSLGANGPHTDALSSPCCCASSSQAVRQPVPALKAAKSFSHSGVNVLEAPQFVSKRVSCSVESGGV
jgi:hypothetical protein